MVICFVTGETGQYCDGKMKSFIMPEIEIDLNDVLELIKKHSRQYAKRQYTWFKNQFDVHWYDVNLENFEQTIEQVTDDIEKILKV